MNVVAGNAFGSGTFTGGWSVSGQNPTGGGHRIAFDSSGGTTVVGGQTRTANIFVHTYNVGTWKSTDGGQNWVAVSATNRPIGIRQMCVDKYGVLWCLDDDFNYPGTNVNE